MPSPFPGMDPFLEDPAGWPDVHHMLLGSIRELLQPAAAPHYLVRIEERVYITDPEGDPGYPKLVPDIIVTEVRRRSLREPVVVGRPTIAEPVKIAMMVEPEVHDYYLEVHDARSREVVAAIEVLSPANKVAGSRGHQAMIEKRDTLRRGGSHWVEIDLLRAGMRARQIARRSDYCATVWPAHETHMYAWFADLRDRLPVIAVPVRHPDDDLPLDLQRALDVAYDRADYARLIDYDAPVPAPALGPADQAWVERALAVWREAQRRATP